MALFYFYDFTMNYSEVMLPDHLLVLRAYLSVLYFHIKCETEISDTSSKFNKNIPELKC